MPCIARIFGAEGDKVVSAKERREGAGVKETESETMGTDSARAGVILPTLSPLPPRRGHFVPARIMGSKSFREVRARKGLDPMERPRSSADKKDSLLGGRGASFALTGAIRTPTSVAVRPGTLRR